jgi:hypothetical protein
MRLVSVLYKAYIISTLYLLMRNKQLPSAGPNIPSLSSDADNSLFTTKGKLVSFLRLNNLSK